MTAPVEPGASLEGEPPPGVDPVALWRAMVTLRAFDERAVALQRQGRMGAYPPFWGEEGVQAGAVAVLRRGDWIFPTYRQNAVPVLRGLPPESVFKYFRGDPRSLFDPFEYACAPQCVPLATHIPHATGWAWGRKLEGRDDVAVAFFGDGATSEGDFHEGVNFAAVVKAPVVFLCTNNQWAISTPVTKQMACERVADKGVGYGIPGVRVDGFDAFAVAAAVGEAVERARSGAGPTLIEAFCYRIGPHGTPDDPSLYRDPADAERWRAVEPLGRLERWLVDRGVLTEEDLEEARADARRAMADAGRRMMAEPEPEPDLLYRHVFADAPASLAGQFREMTA